MMTGWQRHPDGSAVLYVDGESTVRVLWIARGRHTLTFSPADIHTFAGTYPEALASAAWHVAELHAVRRRTLRDRLLSSLEIAPHAIDRVIVEGTQYFPVGPATWGFQAIYTASQRDDTLGDFARTALIDPVAGLPILRDYATDYDYPDVREAAEFFLGDPLYST